MAELILLILGVLLFSYSVGWTADKLLSIYLWEEATERREQWERLNSWGWNLARVLIGMTIILGVMSFISLWQSLAYALEG